MALRMVDDNNEQDDYVQDSNNTGGKPGGGFNIGGLLSFLHLHRQRLRRTNVARSLVWRSINQVQHALKQMSKLCLV